MKSIFIGLLLSLWLPSTRAAGAGGTLENKNISWRWELADGHLRSGLVNDKINGESLALSNDVFHIELGDGTMLAASDFTLLEPPRTETLEPDPNSPTVARHETGKQLVVKLAAPGHNLAAEWHALLRDGSTYLREDLTLRATGKDVVVKSITLFQQTVPAAKTIGRVDGSPVVAGTFFFGYENPMARNLVDESNVVTCSLLRNAELKDGEALSQSAVLGVVPRGQLRRGFLSYIERERSHPYRTFLHYNSWFDIAWATRKYNEAESLDAIHQFSEQLVNKRGVVMDSFLFDDGWDDNQSLWSFHSGFPNGFTPLKQAAAQIHSSIGVWLSPFGGYAQAKLQRIAYARSNGFEVVNGNFVLSGPKYYQRFHDICLEMVNKYGVNQFKFDGLNARAVSNGRARDGDAMLRLIADLRVARPDIYINQTTGTWPSPFWLLYVDSTWRGGADDSFAGKGSSRQRWINYRDTQTYNGVVRAGPLYPVNSLMLHGIIFATNARNLTTTTDQDFADEVHSYFGTGTQLQEMYVTPSLLNQQNWDDLAEAAKWSRANADVLVDTHWIGGSPAANQVYGWASWSPRKAILVLRNPDDAPNTFSGDVQQLFELPDGATKTFRLASPWKKDADMPGIELHAGEPHTFNLQPFQVLVLETK